MIFVEYMQSFLLAEAMIALYYTYILGSSWSWKFPYQTQNRSILPNWREKELLNDYFHSRTLFLLQNASERFFNAYWTFFSTPERPKMSEVSRTAKTTPAFFFHTNPQNRSFFGLGLNKSSIGKLQVYIYISGMSGVWFWWTMLGIPWTASGCSCKKFKYMIRTWDP